MVLLLLTALSISLVAVTKPTQAQDSAISQACLVTDLGRINDGTFNQLAYEGLERAADDFDLDISYIETAAPEDYELNIADCLAQEADVIITVGFALAEATANAAQANPEIYFIGVDQFVADASPNYVGIQFREDQAAFLVGALAALTTESNIVGGVFGPDIPPVVKFRHGYAQGLGFMDLLLDGQEDIELLEDYIPDFNRPDRGADLALEFIDDEADVIFGAGGSTGSGAIAEGAFMGAWVIGVDQDEYVTTFGGGDLEGSDRIITSALKKVDVGVYDMLAVLASGELTAFPGGGNYILDVANGGITFAGPNDSDLPAIYYEIVGLIQVGMAAGEVETGVNPETTEIEQTPQELIEAMTLEIDVPALLAANE
jgi:basic membrane lipoprotein Med (substrate-binding protein (PBP1-ABC) superfamily)